MMSTSFLSMAAYGNLRSAHAANECGVIAVGGTATCTPAGNNFTTGIDYDVNDATIIVQDGVIINTSTNNTIGIASGANGVANGSLAVTSQGTVGIATSGDGSHGISVGTTSGTIAITGSTGTTISTSGATAHGIAAYSAGGNALTINTPGSISTTGNSSVGIIARNTGGATTINAGNISVTGNTTSGVYASSTGGTIDITLSSINAPNAYGVYALSAGVGSGVVNVTTTGTMNTYAYGVFAGSQYGNVNIDTQGLVTTTAAGGSAIVAIATSGNISVTSSGISAVGGSGSYGINARNTSGAISITDTGTLTTGGTAVFANSTAGSTNINVNNIAAGGYGILTYGATGVTVIANGQVATTGNGNDAIYAIGAGAISITTNGLVSATGTGDADGIQAYSYASSVSISATDITTTDDGINTYGATGATVTTTGTVTAGDEGMEVITGAGGNAIVTVNNVIATGTNNDAIRITSGGTATITVNGAVLGGATSSGGAGIDIRSSTGTVINISNGASIGALSGFAIDDTSTGALTINNRGTISGSVIFGAGNDALNNLSSNSVNLSRFTDTNADGIRDTEAVAIMDFGAGTDTFNNSATGALNLSTVTGATAFNTTNETFATGAVGLSLTNAGIEQGHLINLETFINSGTISLSDIETGGTGPVAGDVLVITSLGAPGVGGTSNFISNGGELHLDTVLNNGAVDTSDVLIVDTVTLGTGATAITITNAGGAGGITGTGATDGIRLVEVRGAASASGAFTLSSPVVGGILEYELAQADGQNWYLQSDGSIAKQIPAYQALPMALAGFARDQMPWAQNRWGKLSGQKDVMTGAWVRGGYIRGVSEFGGTGQYESRDRFGQAGYDLALDAGLPGAVSVGALLQHVSTDTNVTNGNGSDFSASGYGAGLNAFWAADSGLFVEALATLNHFDIGINRPGLADVANTYAYTYSVGAQVGHQFELTGETDRWSVTPRASITYIDSAIDDFTDASNIAIDFVESDSLLLEAGMISGLDLDLQGKRILSLTAEVGVEHDLTGAMSLTANTVSFSAEDNDTRGLLGAGATLSLGDNVSLFTKTKLARSFDGDDQTIEGHVGARIRF